MIIHSNIRHMRRYQYAEKKYHFNDGNFLYWKCSVCKRKHGIHRGGAFQTAKLEGYLNGSVPATIDLTFSGPSVGFGAYEFNGNSRVTFGGFMNLSFPMKFKTEVKTDYGKESGEGNIKDGFDSYIIFDALIGPVIKVFSTDRVEILLTPGGHFRYDRFKVIGKSSGGDLYLGFGANAGINVYFTKSLYAAGKFTFAYDFFLTGIDDTIKNGMTILPALGLGYKF
ncbi:hypothetical protein [Treponema brennaborense]|uniref:Uncharacterized protein n=1 Tax=Treponema brennaborense (strain DSM 12168 / CIP 105900 / DD5/3) TaxID=906968 RepID=F4LJE6_TREBD|nr:hypothetical protein [Treponema brennaborense]AEE17391.1 hypothetical protein Trebr_1973 [Treponema brennaborense DSM 12168]